MEFFLNRYRNLSVLLLAILAQLALLAYQIKTNQDVRLIRVWAVTGVTPMARLLESVRYGTTHFFSDYFVLVGVRQQDKQLKTELDRAELENQFLRSQLSTADRAHALALFQATSQSKFLAARIIGNTTDSSARQVIVDRGAHAGVQKDMAVITPEGIVGKVIAVFPTASEVLLITDPSFAAGVVSEKNHTHGTLKGQGHSTVIIDYVQNEEKVDPGERFVTSGDDLIFPRGLPVGQATVVRPGRTEKEIYLTPSAFLNGLEDVLIVLDGVHGAIPQNPLPNEPVHLLTPPPPDNPAPAAASPGSVSPGTGGSPATAAAPTSPASAPGTASNAAPIGPETDLDRQVQRYRVIGEEQNHIYGDGKTHAPNYNAVPKPAPAPAAPAGTPGANLTQTPPVPSRP